MSRTKACARFGGNWWDAAAKGDGHDDTNKARRTKAGRWKEEGEGRSREKGELKPKQDSIGFYLETKS